MLTSEAILARNDIFNATAIKPMGNVLVGGTLISAVILDAGKALYAVTDRHRPPRLYETARQARKPEQTLPAPAI